MIAAYVTPDLVDQVKDAGAVLLVLGTVGGIFAWFGRQFIFEPLRREIAEATKQVRTDANGGQSLNDLHRRINEMDGKVEVVVEKVDGQQNQLDLIVELLRKERQ